MKPKIFDTPNGIYRFVENKHGDYLVYHTRTNLKEATFYPEEKRFRFTDPDATISIYALRDLCDMADNWPIKYDD
jgi:hypothetical protein